MTGKLIVFEGIDKSGKETQARLLTEFLRDQRKTVATFAFPNYESWSGKQIKDWLHNKSIRNQYEVNMLYSLNRYEMKDTLEQCLKDYDYVILDRYYHSNWIYGDFKEHVDQTWLRELDRALPRPHMVILLCISGELSAQRRGSMADIHEQDIPFLNRCNDKYERIGMVNGWIMVDGSDTEEKIAWRIRTSFSPKLTL